MNENLKGKIGRLQTACVELAKRCDGAVDEDGTGFNGVDADFGHQLARVENWSLRQARAAAKMLQKYRGQLAGYGVEIDGITEDDFSEEVQQAEKEADKIDFVNGVFHVYFEYYAPMVAKVKSYKGAVFGAKFYNDANKKFWVFRLENSLSIQQMSREMNFVLTQAAKDALKNPVPKSTAPELPAHRVEICNSKLVFIFDYDPPKVDAVKLIPGREFNKIPSKYPKAWTVLPNATNIEKIIEYFEKFSPVLCDGVDALVKSIAQEANSSVELSKAQDGEIKLDYGVDLFPFQRAGVNYARRKKRTFIADEMGLGKTHQSIATVYAENAFPCLVVCPASVKINWMREIYKGTNREKSVSIWNGKEGSDRTDFVVINYDVIAKHKTSLLSIPFKSVIFDESHYCFDGETKIQTDRGELTIREIVENRLPVSVLSFDFCSNELKYKKVINFWKNELHSILVKVKHSKGEFICTANHKIWTKEFGYVEAGTLKSGTHLRTMRNSFSNAEERQGNGEILFTELFRDSRKQSRQTTNTFRKIEQAANRKSVSGMLQNFLVKVQRQIDHETDVLRKIVCGKMANEQPAAMPSQYSKSIGSILESQYRTQTPRCFRTNEKAQSDVQTRNARKDAAIEKGENFSFTRRQRATNQTANNFSGTFEPADGISDFNNSSKGIIQILAQMLQSGFGDSRKENRHRSGRAFTPNQEMEISRQTQNGNSEFSRVASVEIYESGSFGQSESDSGQNTFVYDLEVEETHNYFANGILASNCKNYKAKRSETAKELAKGKEFVLCLTGTPVMNRPQELLSQLGIMNRLEDLGGFWYFARQYCQAFKGRWGWDFSGAANLEELNEKLRATCLVRRRKADVFSEMPKTIRAEVEVSISNRAEYSAAEQDIISFLRDEAQKDREFLASIAHFSASEQKEEKQKRADSAEWKASRAEALVKLNALKVLAARGKLEAIKEWTEGFLESGEKLVIFAEHIEVQNALVKNFPGCAKISGDDNTEARQENIDRFVNKPDCQIIVCSLAAGGTGIDGLQKVSSNVAFCEQGWTPAIMNQATARLDRFGQTKTVTAWYLLAENTIDFAFKYFFSVIIIFCVKKPK